MATTAELKAEMAERRRGFPPETLRLDELRARLVEAEEPIDWSRVSGPCGTDDAISELHDARVSWLKELIEAHEGPHGDVVRAIAKVAREPFEEELRSWAVERILAA
jgi:hypothetical protein